MDQDGWNRFNLIPVSVYVHSSDSSFLSVVLVHQHFSDIPLPISSTNHISRTLAWSKSFHLKQGPQAFLVSLVSMFAVMVTLAIDYLFQSLSWPWIRICDWKWSIWSNKHASLLISAFHLHLPWRFHHLTFPKMIRGSFLTHLLCI